MGTAVSLLAALAAVVLARLILLGNRDGAADRKGVLADVLAHVVLVAVGGLVSAADSVDDVELVGLLVVLGSGEGVGAAFVLACDASAEGSLAAERTVAVEAGGAFDVADFVLLGSVAGGRVLCDKSLFHFGQGLDLVLNFGLSGEMHVDRLALESGGVGNKGKEEGCSHLI